MRVKVIHKLPEVENCFMKRGKGEKPKSDMSEIADDLG